MIWNFSQACQTTRPHLLHFEDFSSRRRPSRRRSDSILGILLHHELHYSVCRHPVGRNRRRGGGLGQRYQHSGGVSAEHLHLHPCTVVPTVLLVLTQFCRFWASTVPSTKTSPSCPLCWRNGRDSSRFKISIRRSTTSTRNCWRRLPVLSTCSCSWRRVWCFPSTCSRTWQVETSQSVCTFQTVGTTTYILDSGRWHLV